VFLFCANSIEGDDDAVVYPYTDVGQHVGHRLEQVVYVRARPFRPAYRSGTFILRVRLRDGYRKIAEYHHNPAQWRS
jgi:hypothetical protein